MYTTVGRHIACQGLSTTTNDNNNNNRHYTTAIIRKIQVCQNKECCQRYSSRTTNLVQTIRQLTILEINDMHEKQQQHVFPVIESTSCLSLCDKGPNVQLQILSDAKTNNEAKADFVQHGITSVHAAAAVLEMADSQLTIHPTLIAAWKVMEQAQQATHWSEKERFLNSVIQALTKDKLLAKSISLAHALVLRSQLFSKDSDCTTTSSSSLEEQEHHLQQAYCDITRAVTLDPYHPIGWRVLATIQEQRTDIPAAVHALVEWSKYQPQFLTKIQGEIRRLQDE